MRRVCSQPFLQSLVLAWAVAFAAGADQAPSRPVRTSDPDTAVRMARAEAMGKLLAKIESLRLTPAQTVGQWLAGSPELRLKLYLWVSAMRETDTVQVASDGTARVCLRVSLEELAAAFQRMTPAPIGVITTRPSFDKLTEHNRAQIIEACGSGRAAVPPWRLAGRIRPATQSDLFDPGHLTERAAEYWSAHVVPPGRTQAVRAARDHARQRLGERILGVHVGPDLTLDDLLSQPDGSNVSPETFLPAARETGIGYRADAPVVQVRMEIPLRSVYLAVLSWRKGMPDPREQMVSRLEQLVLKSRGERIVQLGVGVPPKASCRDLSLGGALVADLGRNPPEWVGLKAASTGPDGAAARRALGETVASLRLDEQTTVGRLLARTRQGCLNLVTQLQWANPAADSTTAPAVGVGVAYELPLDGVWQLVLYELIRGARTSTQPARPTTTPVSQPTGVLEEVRQ